MLDLRELFLEPLSYPLFGDICLDPSRFHSAYLSLLINYYQFIYQLIFMYQFFISIYFYQFHCINFISKVSIRPNPVKWPSINDVGPFFQFFDFGLMTPKGDVVSETPKPKLVNLSIGLNGGILLFS